MTVVKKAVPKMANHLGHGKNEPVENPAGNTRNGNRHCPEIPPP